MKSPAPLFLVFAVAGTLFVLMACAQLQRPLQLMSQGEIAEGTVIGYVGTGKRGQRARLVQFSAAGRGVITFTSRISSNSSSTQVGQRVQVLYLPATPREAEIDDFQSLWLMPMGFGVLGMLVAAVGFLGWFWLRWQERDRAAALARINTNVMATVDRVEIDPATKKWPRTPFRIYAHWNNPVTSKVHNFQSDYIWFDPTAQVGREIKVRIDPDDPEKYHVDVAFLLQPGNAAH